MLVFPDYDVKNCVDLNFPLSLQTSKLVDEYIQLFRPHFERHDPIGFSGGKKTRSPTHASTSIAKRMLKERAQDNSASIPACGRWPSFYALVRETINMSAASSGI